MADALTADQVLMLKNQHAPSVPDGLALSIWNQESGSGIGSTSSRGAKGPFQVTPIAAADVGMSGADLADPSTGTIAGLKYLEKQFKATNGDPFSTAARYFAGPGAMNNLTATDGRVSTQDYATQVVDKYNKSVSNTGPGTSTPFSVRDDGSVDMPGDSGGGGTSVPGFGDIWNKITAAFSVSSEANASADITLKNAMTNHSDATNAAVEATTKAGELSKDLALEMNMTMQARAGVAARNSSTAGINNNDTNSLFADLVTEYNVNAEEARQAQLAIKDRGNISLLDDPVAFLNAQLVEIPQLTTAHNNAVKIANQNADRLATLNSLVQTQNITDNAQIADISTQAAIKAADIKVQESIVAASNLRKAGEVQLAGLSVNRAVLANKELNELQQVQQSHMMEVYRKQLMDAQKDKAALQKMETENKLRLNSDLKPFGLNINTLSSLKKENQDAVLQVISTGRYGDNPADAIRTLGLIPTAQLTPGQTIVGKTIVDAVGDINQIQFPKKEQQIAEANRRAISIIENMRANPNGGTNNLFHAPGPGVMSEVLTPKNFNPQFIKLLDTVGKSTVGNKVEDTAVVQTAVAAIGVDGYSREMAISDINKYYLLAVGLNNQNYRFQDFGIKSQNSYPIKLDVPSGGLAFGSTPKSNEGFAFSNSIFGSSAKVDLVNPQAVSSLVTYYMAKKVTNQSASPYGTPEGLTAPGAVK